MILTENGTQVNVNDITTIGVDGYWGHYIMVNGEFLTITPETVDQINAGLLDDPDYQDYLAQVATNIPMF